MSTRSSAIHDGFTSKSWYVMDSMGNIQGGHRSAEAAIKHAQTFAPHMAAYESVTVVRRIDATPDSALPAGPREETTTP